MSPIRKRNTRSNTVLNDKNIANATALVHSIEENIDEQVFVKHARTKRCSNNKKQSFDEQVADSSCMETTTNSPIEQPTFTPLQPVSFDLNDNLHDPPTSPPVLMIDATEDTMSSQLFNSNRSAQSATNENHDPSRTPFGNRAKKHLSNNVTRSYIPANVNEESISMNSNTSVDRTPAINRNGSNACSQTVNQSIVVSTERTQRLLNDDNTNNRRTSTPLSASRRQQINGISTGGCNDSFSIDSISSDTYDVLCRFPEFRRLVKAYNNEKQKCQTWINDYCRLQRNYKQLEDNSFPRPSASALTYLVDLVTQIQRSSGRDDPRSDEELARDLGSNRIILTSLKHATPQQTALNLFNHLYPGYRAKVNLGSANNLELSKPGLLESMLVFAQRSSPGVPYKMQDLREALNNSIRGARFQARRANVINHQLAGPIGDINANQNNDQIPHHNDPLNNFDMDIDGPI